MQYSAIIAGTWGMPAIIAACCTQKIIVQ